MDDDDFIWFLQTAVHSFADDKVINGTWKADEAEKLSAEIFNNHLKEKQHTVNQYLRTISYQNERGGYIWFTPDKDDSTSIFLMEIYIVPKLRSKGIGREVMNLLKQEAAILGFTKIRLHVFGHNKRAYQFYESIGFNTTDYNMSLDI